MDKQNACVQIGREVCGVIFRVRPKLFVPRHFEKPRPAQRRTHGLPIFPIADRHRLCFKVTQTLECSHTVADRVILIAANPEIDPSVIECCSMCRSSLRTSSIRCINMIHFFGSAAGVGLASFAPDVRSRWVSRQAKSHGCGIGRRLTNSARRTALPRSIGFEWGITDCPLVHVYRRRSAVSRVP